MSIEMEVIRQSPHHGGMSDNRKRPDINSSPAKYNSKIALTGRPKGDQAHRCLKHSAHQIRAPDGNEKRRLDTTLD